MKYPAIFLFIALLVSSIGFSQSDSLQANDLESQYLTLKDKSNNYQVYKVVKEASMDQFWNSVDDTLATNRTQISALNQEVKSLKAEVSNLNTQVSERDANIVDQASQIENMNFLGMSISKGSYVAFSWSIIFALIIIALVLFMRFKSAHSVTKQAKTDHETVTQEFEAHKQRARENESKLKRDLQTELNLVVDLKQKLGES